MTLLGIQTLQQLQLQLVIIYPIHLHFLLKAKRNIVAERALSSNRRVQASFE